MQQHILLSESGKDSLEEKWDLNISGSPITYNFRTIEFLQNYLVELGKIGSLPQIFQIVIESGQNMSLIRNNISFFKNNKSFLEPINQKM